MPAHIFQPKHPFRPKREDVRFNPRGIAECKLAAGGRYLYPGDFFVGVFRNISSPHLTPPPFKEYFIGRSHGTLVAPEGTPDPGSYILTQIWRDPFRCTTVERWTPPDDVVQIQDIDSVSDELKAIFGKFEVYQG